MTGPTIGEKIPPLTLPATGDQDIALQDYLGKAVVLYFYPKDNTPGCTAESIDFSTHHAAFVQANCVIFGISRDSAASHARFQAKHAMPFALLSDSDEKACRLFAVIKAKNLYGRWSEGIERSTFLIDAAGIWRHEWRKVRVKGHVEEVLEAVRAL